MSKIHIPEGFSLVCGGLMYDLMNWILGSRDKKRSRRIRAISFALIAWLPLLLLSLIAGTLSGEATEITFFKDFPLHVRFLLVVPFLILIEKGFDHAFIEYIRTTGKMISEDQQDRFQRIIQRIDKATNSYLPEIIILLSIYVLLVINWDQLHIFDSTRGFLEQSNTNRLSPTEWYSLLASYPILQLLVFRWIWRWFLWAWSLVSFSRFRLRLEAVHYDTISGLDYLNLMPFQFSMIFLALSAILSANTGFLILFENTPPTSYLIEILVYSLIVILLLYGPLMLFIPQLNLAKSRAIHLFGNLITRHNIDYMDKWVNNPPPEEEALLGSVDSSSLADINASYDAVRTMRLIPWNFRMLITSVIIILLPFAPLVFTLYSFNELITKILGSFIAT